VAAIRPEAALHGGSPLRTVLPAPVVVIVADGLVTGLTMDAAVDHARRHGARKVVVAAPCASGRAAVRFLQHADGFVSLVVDDDFPGIGAYYESFAPLGPEEVRSLLAAAAHFPERRA
jgi:putative phosphoribosyl transferase